ncbi:hypothetical protein C8J56DRAFT_1032295 [Mycena floridula]|nr:hypothetical protein C8J56DRAFT_1032295 [Mycena floridula]
MVVILILPQRLQLPSSARSTTLQTQTRKQYSRDLKNVSSAGSNMEGSVAYFGVTQKIQHFPQLISQWISLWNEGEIVRVTELCLLVSESFDDPNDNGGKNDDGDDERDELGDAKQIKEAPNDQNNT